jgi:peptidoglycan/LPS O-acetylase OafA/YrhL
MNTKNQLYKPEIDGLRALAIVAVIINHVDKNIIPSGYLGVDMFFVISGFVITASLQRLHSTSLLDFLLNFYTKRVKRIVPALVTLVTVTSILICLLNPNPSISLKTAISSLFGFSNLYLLKQSSDYFALSTELNAFAHTWSLGVEEQFYFVFPLLSWVSGFSRLTKNGVKNFFLIITVLSAISLTAFFYFYQVNQAVNYFSMPTRLWEIGTGCLVFLGKKNPSKLFLRIEKAPSLIITIAIIFVLLLPPIFPTLTTIAIVSLTGTLIACLCPKTPIYNFFTNQQVVYIGLISYSLYLWHWSVLCLSRWTIGIHWWSVPFQISLIIVLAVVSYHYVEMPLRHSEWSIFRWKTMGYGVSAILSASLVVISLDKPFKNTFKNASEIINPSKYPDQGVVQQELYCHLPKMAEKAFDDCLKHNEKNKKTIYVIGDSHASNHFPSINDAIDHGLNFRVKLLIDWGFINSLIGKNDCGAYDPCIKNSFRKHLSFFKDNIKRGDIVVFSWARDRVVIEGSLPREKKINSIKILMGKIKDIASVVNNNGGIIILVDDIPKTCNRSVIFEYDIRRQGQLDLCSTTLEISRKDRMGLTEMYKSLLKGGIYYFDPHDYLCISRKCGVTLSNPNILIYGDESPHFTTSSSKLLSKYWHEFLCEFVENQKCGQ